MPLVRYVPGPTPDHNYWTECFVNASDPTRYQHNGQWSGFWSETLEQLVARGAWQRAVDPDLEVDEGL